MSNTTQAAVACPECISRISNLRIGVGAVGMILGVIAIIGLLSGGHATFNTSSNLTWGLPVSTYVFFVLTSTGLTFVASLAMVFGMKDFYPIAKRCIWGAVVTLVIGFISLGLEIGNPIRMLWVIPTNMQVSSPMWWMGLFYLTYAVLLIWKFMLINKGDWTSSQSRAVGIASFVAVIFAHATLGSVFGMMAMRPFWFGPMVPVYFLITAFLSGLAFIMLFINLDYGVNQANMSKGAERAMSFQLPIIFGITLGLVIVFNIAKTITGLWTNVPESNIVARHIVSSPLFQFELWIGMVLPFALMLSGLRHEAKVQALAGALVIVALFIGRYEYVVGGQLIPMFKGAWFDDLTPYTPSMTEIGVVLLAISVGILLYAFGDKKLNLSDVPSQ
ncbi:MAG: polysulfide reductase NrfD [Candidatus Nitricoxidivorans perseverans]|uniref:Polysulfide reductase NrfD n=1 Tax=Candidatus Nitricoxidivorans perseverans TaxID=2975601 RepID=A0AA49J122_9PROT|nr:MAG: polysulfide reductase NrfD [Candidatus Nitricoxidivorans perseverans]